MANTPGSTSTRARSPAERCETTRPREEAGASTPRQSPSGAHASCAALQVQELFQSGADMANVLSNLSIDQLSSMEAILKRVKMSKLQLSSEGSDGSRDDLEVMRREAVPINVPADPSPDAGSPRTRQLGPISERGLSQHHQRLPDQHDLPASHQQPSLDPLGVPPRYQGQALPKPTASASNMHKFMSVMRPGPQDTTSSSKSSLREVDGIPWITYSYRTRGGTKIFTVRVDIDSVNMEDIPSEFQCDNCVYPSANGPEREYKGIRRDYERQCNEQAWKLAHLNPTLLASNRGALGRAVVEMRNVYMNDKSRREKRQEMAERRERGPIEGNLRFRQQGPVLALPRMQIRSQYPQEQLGNGGSTRIQVRPARTLSWQPTKVVDLRHTSSGQRPYSQETTSNHVRPEPSPIDCNARTSSQPLQQEPMNAQAQAQILPTLGTFQVSDNSGSSDGSLEFEGFVQGQFKKLRIRCDFDCIQVEDLPFDFKRANCVYPRSFMVDEGESQHWKSVGVRHAEESYLNEIGWKLCSINYALLAGKRLLLQQALDAYRRRFLHATCQPRAKIGPSLLTERTSATHAPPEILSRTGHSHYHPGHRRQQQQRVRFSDLDLPRRKSAGRRASYVGHIEGKAGADDVPEEDDEEGEGDDEGEDEEEEEQDMVSEDESSEDGSEDESSFSEGDGGFHSQMSLLTFTGSIRTYSLGTGSGSARSRPRISPVALRSLGSASTGSVDPIGRSHSSHPSMSGARKRSTEARQVTSDRQESSYGGKRVRHYVSEREGEEVGPESEDQTEIDASTGEAEPQDQEEDEDEDDWWMSRLQNSEYPEDQSLVSMTTEELIDALTSGYNSDVEDEDEDEDDDGESESFY